MLKIYLARHGQNLDNANGILNGHRDEPLTEKGIEQAHVAAELIRAAGLHFDHIFASPLVRAHKTAEIIAETIAGPKPVVMDELIERDFGSMSGIEQSRIEELCSPDIIKTDTVTYFLDPPGAETFPDLLVRARRLLANLKSEYTDGSILLVTHGDFGKMVYAAYYDLDWQEILTLFHFGNSEVLELSPDPRARETHNSFMIEQHNT